MSQGHPTFHARRGYQTKSAQCVELGRRIGSSVGMKVRNMVNLHSLASLATDACIASTLTEPYWHRTFHNPYLGDVCRCPTNAEVRGLRPSAMREAGRKPRPTQIKDGGAT